MRFNRRASAPAFAAGFPQTSAVTARRIRSGSDLIRRTGPVVLTNGDNTFSIDVSPYKRVSVEAGESGVHNIVGYGSLASTDDKAILANFGSQEAARNGYASLMRAHAGIRVPGTRGVARRGVSMLKWPAGLAALFIVVAFFGAMSGPSQSGAAVAAGIPEGISPQQLAEAQMAVMNAQRAGGAGFNKGEPSLEELANGQYSFQPKLKAPDVQVPELKCAPHGAPAK
jgi:hypothetical protein